MSRKKYTDSTREQFYVLTAVEHVPVIDACERLAIAYDTGKNWPSQDWYKAKEAERTQVIQARAQDWEAELDGYRKAQREKIPKILETLSRIDEMAASGKKTTTLEGKELPLGPKDYNDLATARLKFQEALRVVTGETNAERKEVAAAGKPETTEIDFASFMEALTGDQEDEILRATGAELTPLEPLIEVDR